MTAFPPLSPPIAPTAPIDMHDPTRQACIRRLREDARFDESLPAPAALPPPIPPISPPPTDPDLPLPGIDMRPANAYEAVTRQMVEALQEDLREIKGRLNTLLITLLGAVVLDIVARWLSQ